MSEFSLILVLQKENKQNSNMTWQKYKLNLRNSHLENPGGGDHVTRVRLTPWPFWGLTIDN